MDRHLQWGSAPDQALNLPDLADVLIGIQSTKETLETDTRCMLIAQVLEKYMKMTLPFVGASMLPTIPEGAEVQLEGTDLHLLKPGDIVLFRKKDQLLAHRVVQIRTDDGESWFLTVGDNQGSDGWINFSSILGKITGVRLSNLRCQQNVVSKLGSMTKYWLIKGRIISFIDTQRWLSPKVRPYIISLIIRAFRLYPKGHLDVELVLDRIKLSWATRKVWRDSLYEIKKDGQRVNAEALRSDQLELKPGMILMEGQFGGFLLDQEHMSLKVLNAIGVSILKLCDGEHTVTEIVKVMVSRFTSTYSRDVEMGVYNFLARMVEQGIVLYKPTIQQVTSCIA